MHVLEKGDTLLLASADMTLADLIGTALSKYSGVKPSPIDPALPDPLPISMFPIAGSIVLIEI